MLYHVLNRKNLRLLSANHHPCRTRAEPTLHEINNVAQDTEPTELITQTAAIYVVKKTPDTSVKKEKINKIGREPKNVPDAVLLAICKLAWTKRTNAFKT